MGGLKSLLKEIIYALPLIIFALLSLCLEYLIKLLPLKDLENINNFLLILSALVLSVAFYLWKVCKKPEVDLKHITRSAITGSFPGVATFLFIVLFAIYTSWIADYLKEGEPLRAVAVFFFTVGSVFAFALSIPPSAAGSTKEREPKKVLISALSKPHPELDPEKLKEAFEKGEEGLKGMRHNWAPLLRFYLFHKNAGTLERWYVLVSKESAKYKDKLLEIIGDEKVVRFFPEGEGIDFNRYEDIHYELHRILQEFKRDGYGDEDISVYISGGTSAVTLALTLFAVKEGRQVEYLTQDQESKIIAIDIGLEDLYSFSPELKG